MHGVALAGQRLVAVGMRGHIVLSDDGGRHWRQATVPVSTDLVAVAFPSPQLGWAVGHGGVVLYSADGGQTWGVQLDGHKAARIALEYLTRPGTEVPVAEALVRQAKGQLQDAEAGAPAPFLDVFFESEQVGYVVGAFNRIFKTTDGGQTWTPWMAHIDNPQELNLYGIRGAGEQRYIVGEQGMVWRFDGPGRRFVAVPTAYKGTLFGALVTPSVVLVYGMNGTLFRSVNQGQSWEKVDVGSRAGLTAGEVGADGTILLVNIAGQVLRSTDDGRSFSVLRTAVSMPSYFGIGRAGAGRWGVVGSDGVKVLAFP